MDSEKEKSQIKPKIKALLEENRWVNLLILLLTLTSVVAVSVETIFPQGNFYQLELMEIGILAFFSLEFILGLYVAESLQDYMMEGDGLVDLLSIVSGLSFIKALESVRLLRALRAIRIFKLFDNITGRLLNGIILVQVIVAMAFSTLILEFCKLKTAVIFANIEQILYLYVLVSIFSTLFIVRAISKERLHSTREKRENL